MQVLLSPAQIIEGLGVIQLPKKGSCGEELHWIDVSDRNYTAPFSELAAYTGDAGLGILRFAICCKGRYAHILSEKGYTHGNLRKVLSRELIRDFHLDLD